MCLADKYMSFGGTGTTCFGFLVTSPLGFKARVGYALFTFAEANVMHIPWDPPLMLHLPTSWQPVWQPITCTHACVEVGIGLLSNRQSPPKKTNTLRLCRRPAKRQHYFVCFAWVQGKGSTTSPAKIIVIKRWLYIFHATFPIKFSSKRIVNWKREVAKAEMLWGVPYGEFKIAVILVWK